MSSNPINGQLLLLLDLADSMLKQAAADRQDPEGALHAIVLASFAASVTQARSVASAVAAGVSRGALPNVRAMFELLVTVRYLADPTADSQERDRRLDRYYRAVRRAQVKLRDAIAEYPSLQKALSVDTALADEEKTEFDASEKALPKKERLGDKHWAGLPFGLKSVADVVGLGSDYAFLYRMSSGVAHAARPWDEILFEPEQALVLPNTAAADAVSTPIAFDALRYLAWMMQLVKELGVAPLFQSGQAVLSPLLKYCKPVGVLFEEGLAGAGDDAERPGRSLTE